MAVIASGTNALNNKKHNAGTYPERSISLKSITTLFSNSARVSSVIVLIQLAQKPGVSMKSISGRISLNKMVRVESIKTVECKEVFQKGNSANAVSKRSAMGLLFRKRVITGCYNSSFAKQM